MSNENSRALGFLISEAPFEQSREAATLLGLNSAGSYIEAGTILGRITCGAITSAATAGNTGTGAMGTITAGVDVKPGKYRWEIIRAASNAGTFHLIDPDGVVVGYGNVATAFTSTHLSFTLADATDYVVGDSITITVAAGSGKYKALDPAAIDGSAQPAGILIRRYDVSASTDVAAAIIARNAEVASAELVYGTTDASTKTAIKAKLATIGILVRDSV